MPAGSAPPTGKVRGQLQRGDRERPLSQSRFACDRGSRQQEKRKRKL